MDGLINLGGWRRDLTVGLIIAFVFLFSLIFFILGLIKPKLAFQKSRKKVLQIYPLIMIVSFIVLGIIPEEDKKNQKNITANTEQENKDITQKNTDMPDKKETEKEKLDKAKTTYEKELKPAIDEIIKEFDITHSDFWTTTLLNYSEGKLSAADTYKNIKAGEKRYSQLDRMTSELNGDFLSKENKDLLKEYKKANQMTIIKRQQAHKKMADAINENNLKPAIESEIQNLIDDSDTAMMQAVMKLTELEVALGVKRE